MCSLSPLFQLLKAQGNKAVPRQVAQSVVDNIPTNQLVDKVCGSYAWQFWLYPGPEIKILSRKPNCIF